MSPMCLSPSQAGEPLWRRDSGFSVRLLVLRGVRLSGLCLRPARLLRGGEEDEAGEGPQTQRAGRLPQRGQGSAGRPLLHHALLQGAARPGHRQAGDGEGVEGSEQTESHHAHPAQRLQDLLRAPWWGTTAVTTIRDQWLWLSFRVWVEGMKKQLNRLPPFRMSSWIFWFTFYFVFYSSASVFCFFF